MITLAGALDFVLPAELEAHDPPEADGRARDSVRMLVARGEDPTLRHARATDLPEVLEAGDLVVVNVSATLPAALDATEASGARLRVHVSGPAPPPSDPGAWVVELRLPRGASSLPYSGAAAGDLLDLPGGMRLRVLGPLVAGQTRLWLARPRPAVQGPDLVQYLQSHGQPIRYGRVSGAWPIEHYQTVYATEPGSAEMASAGRPLSRRVLTALMSKGVAVAPVTLHAGVSSPEDGEPPFAERFRVPPATARLANAVRAGGGRLIAVGTTVVRALESVTREDRVVGAGSGWTDLVITPRETAERSGAFPVSRWAGGPSGIGARRGVRAVDGILTGWHEPRASHLALLEAVAGRPALERSYAAALEAGYRWHEFGDLHLVLPE